MDKTEAVELASLTLATGDTITVQEMQKYFDTVLASENSGEAFPVNFDDVWPFAYSRKGDAKVALVRDFREGVDYISSILRNEDGIFRNSPENSNHHLRISPEMVNRPQGGGPQPEQIFLTDKCMEFFVARKVEAIFEIYRQCRKEVTRAVQSGQPLFEPHQQQPHAHQPTPIGIHDKLLFTLDECRQLTGLGRNTLREAIENGTLHAIEVEPNFHVQPCELSNYVRKLAKSSRKTRSLPRSGDLPATMPQYIAALLEATGQWQGTARQLLDELNAVSLPEHQQDDRWPSTAQRLGTVLNLLAAALRDDDVRLERRRKPGTGSRIIYLRRR